jgi:hypothetical protein
MIILLMLTGCYSIDGYWWLLMTIGGYFIDGYFINGYWWLFY